MPAGSGHLPCYTQLYFCNVDIAVNYKLQEHFNQRSISIYSVERKPGTCRVTLEIAYIHEKGVDF